MARAGVCVAGPPAARVARPAAVVGLAVLVGSRAEKLAAAARVRSGIAEAAARRVGCWVG